MVLAAMLTMTTLAAAPPMAKTTSQDYSDLVDFPACFSFCEDSSSDKGVFSNGDFDDGYIDIDGNNRIDHDDRNGDGNGRR